MQSSAKPSFGYKEKAQTLHAGLNWANILYLNIHKRCIKFWSHIKKSDPACYHYKALAYQELNVQSSPLSQLVIKLADLSPSDVTKSSQPQCSYITQKIRPNQIITKEKDQYITYWNDLTQLD